MSKGDNYLIAQHAHLGAELRFLKGHQWRTSYYTVLLYSGVVALFQLDRIILPPWLHCVFKALAAIAIIVIGIFQWIIQEDHRKAMINARADIHKVSKMLDHPMYTKNQTKVRRRRDTRYALTFKIGVTIATLGAAFAILLDR